MLTPSYPWIKAKNEDIIVHTDHQVRQLFPSSRGCNLLWGNVAKLAQSLCREAPGMEPYRPEQCIPVGNFFLTGSYTCQDYVDSMEGATMRELLAAAAILNRPARLATSAVVA